MRKFALFITLLVGLSACQAKMPQYSGTLNGPLLTINRTLNGNIWDKAKLTVSLAKYKGNCDYTLLGRIDDSDFGKGVHLPVGNPISIEAIFQWKDMLGNNTKSETRLFTPKAGAKYKFQLNYNKNSYEVRLLENVRELPFVRSCTW